jgi:cell division protein FtsZ
MGTGEAMGERRAVEAAEAAISNPLLDDISMKGARGVLINITGGLDMTLFEVDEAANRVRDEVDPDANIIFGSTFDAALEGKMRVSVVATGIEVDASQQARPLQLHNPINEQRRPGPSSGIPVSNSRPVAATGGYGGFAGGYERPTPRQDFGGGIPASILPQHNSAPQYTASRTTQQPVARAPQMEQHVPEATQMTVGHAASTPYTAAATARKLQEADVTVEDTWTKPQTQTIQRPTQQPQPSAQPRAERHGNSFIPPKPVDPRTSSHASSSDLFSETPMTAQPRAPIAAEKQVKKSPSIFERFTMQKNETPAAPARHETSPNLSVEEGGKQAEDELDIPAFLRRQAN